MSDPKPSTPEPVRASAFSNGGNLAGVEFSTGERTTNLIEAAAALQMQDAGYEVIRGGWPDFLAVKGDEVLFVEVKPANDATHFRANQVRTLTILRDLGLKVRVFTPDHLTAPIQTGAQDVDDAVLLLRGHSHITLVTARAQENRGIVGKFVNALPSRITLHLPSGDGFPPSARQKAARRMIRMDSAIPSGNYANAHDYRIASVGKLLRMGRIVVVFTDFRCPIANYAIAAAARKGAALYVFDFDGKAYKRGD